MGRQGTSGQWWRERSGTLSTTGSVPFIPFWPWRTLVPTTMLMQMWLQGVRSHWHGWFVNEKSREARRIVTGHEPEQPRGTARRVAAVEPISASGLERLTRTPVLVLKEGSVICGQNRLLHLSIRPLAKPLRLSSQ